MVIEVFGVCKPGARNAGVLVRTGVLQASPWLLAIGLSFSGVAENWPCWRGPRGDGSSHETNLPVYWNGTSNIVWRTELPGAGHASPIVFGDKVFILAALPETQERLLLCLDRNQGNVRWQKTVLSAPLEKKHSLNSFASSTPATDGGLVYVAFGQRPNVRSRV